MTPTYKHVFWVFDAEGFARAVKACCEAHGVDFVSEIMGLTASSISQWAEMDTTGAYKDYPWPKMGNFLAFCNTFEFDPRGFFTTSE